MGIPESWKFLLVESRILVFGIQNTAQGIQNPTKVIIWNLSSTQDWNTVPGIRNPGRGIQDPRLSRIALRDSRLLYSSAADPGLVYPYHLWGGAAYIQIPYNYHNENSKTRRNRARCYSIVESRLLTKFSPAWPKFQ